MRLPSNMRLAQDFIVVLLLVIIRSHLGTAHQCSRPLSEIGTFETSTDVRYMAAFGDNADISQRLPDNRDLRVHALDHSACHSASRALALVAPSYRVGPDLLDEWIGMVLGTPVLGLPA